MAVDPILDLTDVAYPGRGASPARLTSRLADLTRRVKFLETSVSHQLVAPSVFNGNGGLNWTQNFTVQHDGATLLIWAQASGSRSTTGAATLSLRFDGDASTDLNVHWTFSATGSRLLLPAITMVQVGVPAGEHNFLYFHDGTVVTDSSDVHLGWVLEIS